MTTPTSASESRWGAFAARGLFCATCVGVGVLAGLAVRAALRDAGEVVERREELQSLPSGEQLQLIRRQERFARLDSDRKQRLRELQAELDAAEDEEQLRSVMRQYYDWLGSLEAVDQAELLSLAADMDKRIARVKELQSQQRRFRPFTTEDVLFVGGWVEERLRPQLSPEELTKLNDIVPPPHRRLEVARLAQQHWGGRAMPGGNANLNQIATEENFQSLLAGLGPIARERMQELRDRHEKFMGRDALRGAMQSIFGMVSHELTRQSMQYDLKQLGVTKEQIVEHVRAKFDEDRKNFVFRSQPWLRDFLVPYYYLRDKFPERYPETNPFPFGRRPSGGGEGRGNEGRPGGSPPPAGGSGPRQPPNGGAPPLG